jgi:hypothetical protein
MKLTKIESFNEIMINEIMINFTKTKDDLILYRDNEGKKQQDAYDEIDIQHDKIKACSYTMEKANKAIYAIKELLGE